MEDREDDVAVVGIGCNFPGGEGLDNFWKVLVEGRNCTVQIPQARFDMASWYDPDDTKAGKSHTAKAALIEGFNEFDHKFFGLSDSEVEQMDPQQKLLLQCVYRALENAGIPLEKASGTRTGVFVGLMNRDYETNASHVHPSVINHWTGTGVAMSITANRVSYIFNFTGPSLSIDCACSSSLVALHLACQSIKQGDCDMAVCGGVSCIIEPRVFVALSKAKMISPEGTSKPFSNRADGYGRGEGCGVVLLKPLKKAIQDHDNIWGIISKTAVNQDGHSVSPITKPSMSQQEELLRRTYSASDLADVQFIEAHGTGTPVGDPTEASSISNVIAKAKSPSAETLRIGSVKGNIGHTESAAGVAGLIKVFLMMKHETFVPTVFFTEETAGIDAKALNIKVPMKTEKWEASGQRIAGVNNFGFGGTNAHAVVKQCNQSPDKPKSDEKQAKCFVLSANSPKSLKLMIEDTINELEKNDQINLDSLLYTAACRRSHLKHKYRKAIAVSSVADLKEKLLATADKNISQAYSDPRLVFVYCGNGLTYLGMCKLLLQHEPVFREKVREISQLYQNLSELNIFDRLQSDFKGCDFTNPGVAQPLLFAIQVAITRLLRQWGVKPDGILGHSVGEVAAAHCSGLLSLEDAVKVIYVRSTLQSKVTGGKMLVISNMAVTEVTALLPKYSDRISLAAFNSPQSCTLSGDVDAIVNLNKELGTLVESKNLFLHLLEVPAAYHSQMMDPILTEIEESIGSLHFNDLDTELFSTVTGKEVQKEDFCTGKYWAKNIRAPVAFEQAVRSAAKERKNTIFVEIGPRRALERNIKETLGSNTAVLASVLPDKDRETLMSSVSKLFELGFHVNWDSFFRGFETIPLSIPKYQFDCANRDVIIGPAQKKRTSNHPVLFQSGSESNIFNCNLTSESSFYLEQHKHNGVPILPGAFYAELGLATFMTSAKPKLPLSSVQLSVSFHIPFVLMQNSPDLKVQLQQTETDTKFKILSPSAMYASGKVSSKKERLVEEQSISLNSIFKRCKSVKSANELYGYLSQGGFQYGDVFQNKGDVHCCRELQEVYAVVTVPEQIRSQLDDYYIHPVVLDFMMQLLPVTVEHIFPGRPGFPVKIGSLTVCEPLQDEMIVYLRATDVGTDHFEICGCFADKEGRVLVEVKQVNLKYLKGASHVVKEYFYHNAFSAVSKDFKSTPPPKALVFSDHIRITNGLKQYLDSESRYISCTHADDCLSQGYPSLLPDLNTTDIATKFDEILFLWGKEDLTAMTADAVLKNVVNYCEIFRRIVVELKQINFPNSIRTITYCSSDLTVDHISPGFVLSGLTRSLAAEIPELSFQLIDVHSISDKDIEALSVVLGSCPCSKYPELVVKDGLILKPTIVHTTPDTTDSSKSSLTLTTSEPFVLQTADVHEMVHLSAIHFEEKAQQLSNTSVEIQPTKISVHSSDYFPVSDSHLRFGQALYWNKYSSQNHKLLALDFSGTVTAVGKDVRKLKVGDHVATCYPVVAASRVRVPENVCYKTKRLQFLRDQPCVSYFVLAWEILHRALPKAKHNLGVISSVPDSTLMEVLALTSSKSGWKVIVGRQGFGTFVNFSHINAFVVLPPFDECLVLKICRFPGVQHLVLVCDNQMQGLLAQDVLHDVKESVHVQTIQMPFILQKGCLIAKRQHIYNWMKYLNLGRDFAPDSYTFQSVQSENVKSQNSEKTQSYFSSKKLGVVSLEDGIHTAKSDIPLLPTRRQLFQKKAVYIVAGGLSGLGFETVKFISQRGGGYIVILSRSKPTPKTQQELHHIEKLCENCVTTMECDISVSDYVHKAISVIGRKFFGHPIKGVFHSAVVLHDGLIATLDRSCYEKVLKPKVNGALNLHSATLHCPLDYFVCYSSISAFLGNAAQTNYAAANTFLDLFCQYRRKLGLPGQSINWGALNLGLLLNKDHIQQFLESRGIMVLEVAEVNESLEQCLLLNRPQQAICRFNFKNIRYNVLSQNAALTVRLLPLVEEAFKNSEETDSESKPTASMSPREYIVSLLSETTGMEESELKDDCLLSTLGIDSMQTMTLQNKIFQERGVNVPLVKLLDPSVTLSSAVALLSVEGESLSDQNKELSVRL